MHRKIKTLGGQIDKLQRAKNKRNLTAETPIPSQFETVDQMRAPDGNQSRLLIVEDNQTNQMVITKMLKAMGFHYEVVDSGQAAIDAILQETFSLVLMDINMPEMDGIETMRKIRGLPDNKGSLPIIALTANAMITERQEYLSVGMDGHIAKPFRPKNLFQVILDHTS